MRSKTKLVLIVIACTLLLAFAEPDKLSGRWESKPSVNGNTTGVLFKEDHTFVAYVNKKPFTNGNYTFQDDLFTFTDTGCEGMQGVYKIHFFHNNDSLRMQAISDSCEERRNGMQRLILGRVK